MPNGLYAGNRSGRIAVLRAGTTMRDVTELRVGGAPAALHPTTMINKTGGPALRGEFELRVPNNTTRRMTL